MGKEWVLYMQPYDKLPSRTTTTAPPAVCLAKGLADDHRDCLLAVPRDCPLKIKFVGGGSTEKLKSALCVLYVCAIIWLWVVLRPGRFAA